MLYEQYKFRKTKRAEEHTPFLKNKASYESMCEIVKLSGLVRPQIKICLMQFLMVISYYKHNDPSLMTEKLKKNVILLHSF